MKKSLIRMVAVALVLAAASYALAADGSSWTGWVTDTHCAAKADMLSNAECATKCVKDKGAKWAFVNSADKSVWVLSNQDAAGKWAGKEVTVKGTTDAASKTMTVASIEPAKK